MRWFTLAVVLVVVAGCAAPDLSKDVRIQDIHGIALDPAISSRLYVATHHGLFLGENDTRWSAVTQQPFDMMGFTMHPSDGRIMYASGHPGRVGQGWAVGVVKSTDAGATWTTLGLQNQVDFHAMAMEAGREGGSDTVYGFHDGKVHFSSDGGRAWQNEPVAFSVASLSVDPNTGELWAAAQDGIYRANRHLAGDWTQVSRSPALVVFAATHGLYAYLANGGLARSSDGAATWAQLNWTVPSGDFPWGLTAEAGGMTVYAATARGSIFKSSDAGATWRPIR